MRDPQVLGVSLTSRSDNSMFWCLSCEIQNSYPDGFWGCFLKPKLSPTDPENTINVRSQSTPRHWHTIEDRKICFTEVCRGFFSNLVGVPEDTAVTMIVSCLCENVQLPKEEPGNLFPFSQVLINYKSIAHFPESGNPGDEQGGHH